MLWQLSESRPFTTIEESCEYRKSRDDGRESTSLVLKGLMFIKVNMEQIRGSSITYIKLQTGLPFSQHRENCNVYKEQNNSLMDV